MAVKKSDIKTNETQCLDQETLLANLWLIAVVVGLRPIRGMNSMIMETNGTDPEFHEGLFGHKEQEYAL